MMKKVFQYKFLGSKEEEEAAKARGVPYQVTRELVEIRDLYPPGQADPSNPWVIRKTLSGDEIVAGKLLLSHKDIDQVLRHCSMEVANYMLTGSRHYMTVVDCTDSDNPRTYRSECMYYNVGGWYEVGCMDAMRNRSFRCGDEIGLFWDTNSDALNLKLLNHASSSC